MLKNMLKRKMVAVILAVVTLLGTCATSVAACEEGYYSSNYVNPYRFCVGGYYYGEDVTRNTFEVDAAFYDSQVCPDSHMRYLSASELRNFSGLYPLIARNEIYAREGYKFGNVDLCRYFCYKNWYHPTEYFNESYLNVYERYNVDLIVAEENRRGGAVKLYWNN